MSIQWKRPNPKSAFLLHSVGGKVNDHGTYRLNKNHLHYYQVQTAMAVTGLSCCDFVTYTSKGIHVAQIYFDQEFWTNISAKAPLFYTERIIPYMFVEIMKQFTNGELLKIDFSYFGLDDICFVQKVYVFAF